jgi:hypothetical protein
VIEAGQRNVEDVAGAHHGSARKAVSAVKSVS